jgi:hypothetical protein
MLLISKHGLEAYTALLKLAGDRDIVWISSNPYLPYKVLKGRKAKILSFNTTRFGSTSINPSNLQEIIIQTSKNASPNCAVIISCISELLAIHGLNKLYSFLMHLITAVEERGGIVIGMLIEGAQLKRDEILISTLFDTILKLREDKDKFVLVPLIPNLNRKEIKLKFLEAFTNEVDFRTSFS